VITQEVLDVKEDFVELLTHDSYLIQVRLLAGKSRTQLERVLQVFSPEYLTDDEHQLDFKGDISEPLVRKMVDRLGRAIASEEMRNRMDLEDEIDGIFERALGKKDKIIAEKDLEILIEKQRAEKERQNAEKEKQNAEKERRNAEKEKQNAEIEKQNAEKERQNAEIERQKNEALLKEIEALKQQLKK
jgi:hypothetical protein